MNLTNPTVPLLDPRAPLRLLMLVAALAAALAFTLALPTGAQALEQKVVAGDGAADGQLGRSVAIDGDTAVVGAPGDDDTRGAVYVFTRTADSWTQTAKLTASDGAASDALGHSVAIDGDTIVAGAYLDDVGANPDQGSAYTFARTGGNRTETAKLTASDGAAMEFLGFSVAIDGDTIVAGAFVDNVGANGSQGSAYTFARTGGNRTETAKLTASDGAANDHIGFSVAIDGDTIVAGAPGDDVGANQDQGSAYTFARTGGNRTETAKLTASDGAAGDQLGRSVAIDGDTIIAGTSGDNVGSNPDQGSAYTFARTGGSRTQTAKLTASDGAAGDQLGISVAIDGDTIVAGTFGDDGAQGSAYTFARTGGNRTETAKLTASDGAPTDELGYSVAIDGDTIAAGAPGDDVGANADQGSASIFFAAAPAACSDSEDNDNDGLIDFGEDPGCDSAEDNDEADPPPPPPQCSDGADNDGDEKIDFGAAATNDPGCSSAADDDEQNPPQCADGIDNDGDGKTDHPSDSGCKSAEDDREASTLVTEDLGGAPDPTTLAQTLAGSGVAVSNVNFTGVDRSGGTFAGGAGILDVGSGVALSSGDIRNVSGPNESDGTSTENGTPGDSNLTTLAGSPTADASILEFDFKPNRDRVTFKYVFSSEEYNEYVKAGFNDVFAFYVNGQNCALVPGTSDPVSIDTINNGNPFGDDNKSHPELYRNNDLSDGGGSIDTEMDGLTKVLTCTAPVNAGQVNRMKLAIADGGDSALDSNVFLERDSLISTACSDGKDNDGDGKTDFGAGANNDPGCESANDDSEDSESPPAAQCGDGQDNDSDTKVDFPDDQGCSSATDDSEAPDAPQCSDRLDNDSDSKSNFPDDQGCSSATDDTEAPDAPQCSDRLDNDSDSKSNFPDDQGCANAEDNTEAPDAPQCSDRLDNDNDSKSNFPDDQGCANAEDNTEAPDAPQCSDRLDNDNDSKSNFPDDQGCANAEDNTEAPDAPQCSDRLDNDNDSKSNFPDDPGCTSANDDDETDPVSTPSVSVGDDEVTEGDSGTTNARFEVRLSHAATETVSVDYATGDGSAKAPGDYAARSGTLTFAPGQTVRAVNVPVRGDLVKESTESFVLRLTEPENASLGDRIGKGLILDSDICTIVGTEGNDVLVGTTRSDVICALGGDDRVTTAKAGNDILLGGDGRDVMNAGSGSDRLDGEDGNDDLRGSHQRDFLDGGAGNDVLEPGTGNDDVDGGTGSADRLNVATAPSAVVVDLSDGVATGGHGTDSLTSVEHASGSPHADELIGTSGPNRLTGNNGRDEIRGLGGDDVLLGENGNDRIFGGAGLDLLIGGSQIDFLDGGADTDTCRTGETRQSCEKR